MSQFQAIKIANYSPVSEGFAKLRRLGSSKIHLAEVGAELFVPSVSFGAAFWGIPGPVTTICRAVLKDSRPIVAMVKESAVTCLTCRRLQGPEE